MMDDLGTPILGNLHGQAHLTFRFPTLQRVAATRVSIHRKHLMAAWICTRSSEWAWLRHWWRTDGLRVGSCYGKSTIYTCEWFDKWWIFHCHVWWTGGIFSGPSPSGAGPSIVFWGVWRLPAGSLICGELQGILMEAVAGVCFPYLSTTASCLMQPGSWNSLGFWNIFLWKWMWMDDHGEVPTVQTCVEPGCHFFGGWGWQRAAGGAGETCPWKERSI